MYLQTIREEIRKLQAEVDYQREINRGATLAQLIKSKATLPQRLILARTILEGLCTLHER